MYLIHRFKYKVFSVLLWWLAPVFVALFVEVCSGKFYFNRMLNFTENLFFGLLFFSLPLLVSNQKISNRLNALHFTVFTLFLFLETIYFTWFGTNFSASSIFVLFETNVAEANEFIMFYISPFTIIYAFLAFIHLFFFWKFKAYSNAITTLNFNKKIVLFGLVCVLFFLRYTKLIDQNFPYLVVRGAVEYQQERNKLAELTIDETYGTFSNVISTANKSRTFVLVIGESSTRNNFEIYGYPRNNNPKLSERANNLIVFEDVISTNAFTIEALKTAMSLSDFKEEQESTIIQLFNQAGFETHWISNQRPIGPYESIVTKMSRASTFYTYTNTATAGRKTPLDEVLLPHFQIALNRNAKDKFIVLHLLGTHLQYQDRYPSSFKKYTDKPPKLFADHANAIEKRNAYDNAILYNDFLIDEIIKQLSQQAGENFLLYFSDHGDEVFTSTDFAGHNDDNPTPAMFEIPFVLWHSNPKEEWKLSAIKKYSTRHLIHSIADLSGIQFDEWEASKSIFSPEFEEIPRIISQGRNYDEWISNKK